MPGRQGRHECHCAAQNKARLIKLAFHPVVTETGLDASCMRPGAPLCQPRQASHRWVTIDIGQLHGMQAPGLKAALLKEA